jgi:hypothetical protein
MNDVDSKRILTDMREASSKLLDDFCRGPWRYIDPVCPADGVTNGTTFMSLDAYEQTFGRAYEPPPNN